jgi:plastocyanin domain-containing protein
MSGIDWLVVAGGLGLIGWVNWYFFLAERGSVVAAGGGGGVQQVTVTVRGGYDPSSIRVRAGEPVRIVFDRQETSGCSEEVVIPAFGIRRFLPAFQQTVVEVTPAAAGNYEFTCGMGMLRGEIRAEPSPATASAGGGGNG